MLMAGCASQPGSPTPEAGILASVGRDFRQLTAHVKCWDRSTQALFEQHGIPREDCLLQNREELIVWCEWMEAHHIRSYLEIGIWTGQTISLLDELFTFKRVAAADTLAASVFGLPVRLYPHVNLYRGDSHDPAYVAWRQSQPAFDLVMIDGDHSYEGVRRDFEINRALPHRFLAFHDITGHHENTAGVKQLWDELGGHKIEIVRPHVELGLDHSTMGIGIWRA